MAKSAGDLKPKAPDEAKAKSADKTEEPSGEGKSSGGGGGNRVTASMPSIPKGGGAIRGIGEKFSANPVTGTASFQVPIATSPGRGGFHPELSLSYDSGAGNGIFGHGFSLSVPHVTRKTDRGLPEYGDADTFILSGAEDLVPKQFKDPDGNWQLERFHDTEDDEWVTRYSPRVEGAFVRIEKRETTTGNVYWQATTHDNVTSTYGKSAGARIAKPGFDKQIFTWLLEETTDDKGNVIYYRYKAEDLANVPAWVPQEAHRHKGLAPVTNLHLKRIKYGNTVAPTKEAPDVSDSCVFEVVFDYGEHDLDEPVPEDPEDGPQWLPRQDPFSTYRAGFEIRTYRLCQRVLMFHRMSELGAEACLVASTDLTYLPDYVLTQLVAATHSGYIRDSEGHYSKKSHPPVELQYSPATLHTSVKVVPRKEIPDLPEGVRGAYQWVDLDGEGLPGVLSQQAGALTYKKNLGGGKLAPAKVLMTKPSMAGGQVADIDGDGEKELVFHEPPVVGFQDRTEEGSWGPFRAMPSQPLISWSDPNLRFIDLTGDGLEDVLVAWCDNRFLWFKSLGKNGYSAPISYHKLNDEERGPGPKVVFADEVQTIFLADMTGDGLTDIVRILNGNVCYWPNLGRGRFGAKVQMGTAPRFDYPNLFNPQRIVLADVDGSGTTDLLYIHANGIRVYRNRSGNTFDAAVELPPFPDHSPLSSISAVDLLGTGTACLVWSTSLPSQAHAPMRYVDLLDSKKPYLLTTITNNMGLTTTLEYTPSTKLYRDDAVAGRPWVTKLPFPVQTLTRVETFDAVSRHKFVTLYKYHHGYFDGREREFRGFAMVEQWDTESFSAFCGIGELPSNGTSEEFHQPPVHTKTWFHTGAWMPGKLARMYAHEYYTGDSLAHDLEDCVIPSGLTTDEAREASRALKGQMLRQEMYAEDGTAAAPHPYLVTEHRYEVVKVQPVVKIPSKGLGTEGRLIHGVFFSHAKEALECHYERNPDDPRITHAFTLEVDDYGVVTKSAAVGYPRRVAKQEYPEQGKITITLSEVDVVHHPTVNETGWYRIGVPAETRGYEITGVKPAADALFSFEDLVAGIAAAETEAVLRYDETPPTVGARKRLLSQARTLYQNDAQTTVLPFKQIDSHALVYQSYTKAFSPALLDDVLGSRINDDILAEGGYVKLGSDEDWWVPSGRAWVDTAHFFLPTEFRDPFDNVTTVTYDGTYYLFVTQVDAPLGNTVHAAYDLRVLAPFHVTDPNGNQAKAAFDELGLVVKTAVMGSSPTEGDTLEHPTTTFEYDLFRFKDTGKPNMVHGRARETHRDSGTRWQESYGYSDGSGHEVMRKVQAEPGLAPQRGDTGALVHDTDGHLVLASTSTRWVGTGRTVIDNKGNPVKQYEPFFSSTHEYEDEAELTEWGVTPILRYDPLGRLVRTDLPNGTFSKVVFDPWKETHYDPNDTVGESAWHAERNAITDHTDPEYKAAQKAAEHDDTPTVMHLDALGRKFLTLEDNKDTLPYATKVVLDIEGNALDVVDAREVHAQVSTFAMGGRKLHQKSCDAGERWSLSDVGGGLLRAWDQRGFTRRATYDELRRVTHAYVKPSDADEWLAERTVYGESVLVDSIDPATTNHYGKVYRHYDGAGLVTNVEFDFKGNLLEGQRRLTAAYDDDHIDWIALADLTSPADIADAAESLLQDEIFASATLYDALNRPTSITSPDFSETKPTYNVAGLLEKVETKLLGATDWTTFVANIDYNAKGQRELIEYGHGASTEYTMSTEYTYDPLTFRLTRLKTTRSGESDPENPTVTGYAVLQNLSYFYDPVGNITHISDSAQREVFFDEDVVSPSTSYTYDALYRLIRARGRELAGGLADVQRDDQNLPLQNLPHANDTNAVRRYTETYSYDAVGNILSMAHDSGSAPTSWTRTYSYEVDGSTPKSNRLVTTSLPGGLTAHYTYDDHGNMATMPHLPAIHWDFADQMQHVELPDTADVFFQYDSSGQRVRKVWEHSGYIEERIYLGGWEIYRKTNSSNTLVLERETLHVMDGVQRIALVETKTVDTSISGFTATTVVRYQLGNHLGSACLEVDGEGAVISYEEYHPYGTTSYRSGTGAAEVSLKRYRYTGKERDEETGLYYHGARYYAPWLGRWTAADPAAMVDGPNLFSYTRSNPIRWHDPGGTTTCDPNLASCNEPQANSGDPLNPRNHDTAKSYRAAVDQHAKASKPSWAPTLPSAATPGARETAYKAAGAVYGTLQYKAGLLGSAFKMPWEMGLKHAAPEDEKAFAEGAATALTFLSAQDMQQALSMAWGAGWNEGAGSSIPGRTHGLAAVTHADAEIIMVEARLLEAKAVAGAATAASILQMSSLGPSGAGPAGPPATGGSAATGPSAAPGAASAPASSGAPAAPPAASPWTKRDQRLYNDKIAKINGFIGESRGWEAAQKSGHIGIQGPGNPNARGVDYITFDPRTKEIVVWDAKYRSAGGSYPKSIKPAQMKRWMSEVQDAVNNLSNDSPMVNEIRNALSAGRVRGQIYRYP